jgi:hypothetical protein
MIVMNISESVRIVSESARIFLRGIRVRFSGIKQYSGDADKICEQIILDCYNKQKNYFMVSNGHFCEFYARDFGWCTEALLDLGYRKEVLRTLDYALGTFQKHGRIEQSINPQGQPFTFPNKYSPDALAFIIRSLKLAKAKELVREYESLLNNEIKRYYDLVIDKKTGLVRKDKSFSSMKDYSLRQSSCYDTVMTGMLAQDLTELKLDNPFKKWNYKELLLKNFWARDYFLDDLSGSKIICGDANTLPFWSGIITGKMMLKKTIASVRKEGLDKPFPIKYTRAKFGEQKMIGKEFFAGNYERDAIWPHVGFMYIKVVAQIDEKLAKQYLAEYRDQIERHKSFLEVYDKDGRPFKNFFFHADEGMLWSANYLYLKKKLKQLNH